MIKPIILFTLVATLASSCTKDGATGPQGPTGATGAQGPAGNATMYVYKYKVDTTQWIGLDHANPVNYYAIIPQLTPKVVTSGNIQVYYSSDTTSTWTEWGTWNGAELISYSTFSDSLDIGYTIGAYPGVVTGKDFYNPTYFKVVIIAP